MVMAIDLDVSADKNISPPVQVSTTSVSNGEQSSTLGHPLETGAIKAFPRKSVLLYKTLPFRYHGSLTEQFQTVVNNVERQLKEGFCFERLE
jgi:hypothetical protein